MARRQQVNTNIGTNQLQGSVQGISVPQPSVEQLRDTRADNFLKQLSTAKKGMDMVIGYGQQQAQQAYAEVQQKESAKLTEAQKALALEESKQEQIERQIKLENLKQAKINNEIEIINARYSADGRERAAEERRKAQEKEAKAAFDAANKQLQEELQRKGMAVIGVSLPDDPQNIEAMKILVDVGRQKEAEGFVGTNRTINSFLVNQGIKVADKAYEDEKARRIESGVAPMSEYEASQLYQNTVIDYVNSVGGDFGDAELRAYESLQKSFGTVYETSLDESSKYIAESIKEAEKIKESTRQINFVAQMFDTSTDVVGKAVKIHDEYGRRIANGEDNRAVAKDLAGVFEEYLEKNPGSASIEVLNSTLGGMTALADSDPEKYAGLIAVAGQIENIKEDASKKYDAQAQYVKTKMGRLTDEDLLEGSEFYNDTVNAIENISDPKERQLVRDRLTNKTKVAKERYDSDQKRLGIVKDVAKVLAADKDDQALIKKDLANTKAMLDFNQKTTQDADGNTVPTNYISGWVATIAEYKGGLNSTFMGGSEYLGLGLNPARDADTAQYYVDELKRIEASGLVNPYNLKRFKEMNPELVEAQEMMDASKVLNKPIDYIIAQRKDKVLSRGEVAYKNLSPERQRDVANVMKVLNDEKFTIKEQDMFGSGYSDVKVKLSELPGEIGDMAFYAAAEFAYDFDITDEDKIKKYIEYKFQDIKVTEQGVIESDIAGAEDVFDHDGFIVPEVALQAITMAAGYDWDDPEDISRMNVATRIEGYDELRLVRNRMADAYDIMAISDDGNPKRLNIDPIPRVVFDMLHVEKNQ